VTSDEPEGNRKSKQVLRRFPPQDDRVIMHWRAGQWRARLGLLYRPLGSGCGSDVRSSSVNRDE
jgi:hypothetical protein